RKRRSRFESELNETGISSGVHSNRENRRQVKSIIDGRPGDLLSVEPQRAPWPSGAPSLHLHGLVGIQLAVSIEDTPLHRVDHLLEIDDIMIRTKACP